MNVEDKFTNAIYPPFEYWEEEDVREGIIEKISKSCNIDMAYEDFLLKDEVIRNAFTLENFIWPDLNKVNLYSKKVDISNILEILSYDQIYMPVVLYYNGFYHVVDGTHRLSIAKMKKVKFFNVIVKIF